MKIHLITKRNIELFVSLYPGSEAGLIKWLRKLKGASWNTPADIKKTFGNADLLGNGSNRVVFNIGGNNYRLLCEYFFGEKEVRLYVCWIGSHTHYDEICKNKQQYSTNIY